MQHPWGAVRAAALGAAFALAGGGANAAEGETCAACHGSADGGAPVVPPAAVAASAHGRLGCAACHPDAAEVPHPARPRAPGCGRCHTAEMRAYRASDHGRALGAARREAEVCGDCHGPVHAIRARADPRSPVHRTSIPVTCGRCHEDDRRMAGTGLTERHPLSSYAHTVHGEAHRRGRLEAAICSDCHGSHAIDAPASAASTIHWRRTPDTCGRCHPAELAAFRGSIHGRASARGVREAPVCTSCHGEHTIRPPGDRGSSVWRGAVTKTCSGCHASERLVAKFGLPADRLSSFLDTYHGLAWRRGDLKVANCGSCHGTHDVLPASDSASRVNPANLAATCGRCHPGAGARLAAGRVHGPAARKHWTLVLVRWFYLLLIPLTVGGMLVHNALDLVRKAGAGARPAGKEAAAELRLTVQERWQHAALAAAFAVLAYSGFALKWPEDWWAAPLGWLAEAGRKGVHRWTALAFVLLAAWHLWYLGWTARGRAVILALLPRRVDWDEFKARLGRPAPRPAVGRFGYAEKVEYWSLVWGSVVMVLTGTVLVFNDLVLRFLAPWVPDLATSVHFYEAVLACLAVLVWHGYAVVFDPEVYPMNPAWLTGRRGRGRTMTAVTPARKTP